MNRLLLGLGAATALLSMGAVCHNRAPPEEPPPALSEELTRMNQDAERLLNDLANANLNDPQTKARIEAAIQALMRQKLQSLGHFPTIWGKPFSTWFQHLEQMDAGLMEALMQLDAGNRDYVRSGVQKFKDNKRRLESELQ